MAHLTLTLDNKLAIGYHQAWLMLCHDRFIGICKEWNDAEGSGLILVADGSTIQVNWTGILFVGDPLLIPKERLEFGIILDSCGYRRAIYVTGPNGYYLNSNRWPNRLRLLKRKLQYKMDEIEHIMHENKEGSESRSETKFLIQRLSGNMHPNGQLDENSKTTLKQWLEEDSIDSKPIKPTSKEKLPKSTTEDKATLLAVHTPKKHAKHQKHVSPSHVRNACEERQFEEEMNAFYKESLPDLSTKRHKSEFYLAIRDIIKTFHDEYYPMQSWSVFKFGSITWRIDNTHSDIDVAIKMNTRTTHRMHKHQKQEILQRLSCFIKENESDKYKLMTILHARWPIIRIEHRELEMQMDVSISNDLRVKYTKHIILEFIDSYTAKHGYPMRKLIVLVKYWSKQRCINDSPNRFINSFGFTLMVIKFIQHLIFGHQKYINLSHLLYCFFVFYGCAFDATKHAIDVMDEGHGEWNEKMSNKVLEIIDPANIQNNVTNNVRQSQYTKINVEFNRAMQIYRVYMTKQQNQTMHMTLFKLLTEKGTKMAINYENASC
eukprot:130810_1